ncbi:hypothetical protein [Streptomyces malaysiense]|uniref:Uncharacterized protein n=1 Tax=Streptomyces malaysiense TaxID=1428626 RepID=A0A1J4PST1_9ACTN|nr:hypothetical protein [Streptomyces malaysiense]OIK23770.1 hypothetical protein VT52_031120 [Streptomyces malaysiense]
MIFGNKGRERFCEAVAGFEAAVLERDTARAEHEFQQLHQHFQGAGAQETAQAAPRLAALLPEIPPGPRGTVAVIVGACVERGADPAVCAPRLLDGLAGTLAGVREFCERWAATGGGELPDPEGEQDPGLFDRVGPEAALAWLTLPQWEMAGVAMLNHAAVRTALGTDRRTALLTALREVQEASGHEFKCLHYALLVLDDEPLIVLDRPTGTGFALRMSGLGDNFQLHTLLADVLIGGGHLPGRAPSAEEAAVCRDQPGQVHTTGSFNLVSPTGEWVWNEGTPSDIPVVDGTRLLVLDPPPYQRSWPAGRFFPHMSGDLVLERALAPEEAARLLAGCVTKEARGD